MKNWIKYIICASLFTTVSCGDNFLEIKPLSIFTPESIYTDKAGFDGILVNLRKNLRPDFYGEGGGLASELIASDIAISANKAAMNYFLFDKGSEKDWAKEYGGISSVETFGYSGTSSSDSTSSSSSYSTSSTRSSYQQESYSTTSSSHTTYSTRSTTTRSTEERVTESTTSQPQTSAPRPTTAHHTTTAAATESTPSDDSVEEE